MTSVAESHAQEDDGESEMNLKTAKKPLGLSTFKAT